MDTKKIWSVISSIIVIVFVWYNGYNWYKSKQVVDTYNHQNTIRVEVYSNLTKEWRISEEWYNKIKTATNQAIKTVCPYFKAEEDKKECNAIYEYLLKISNTFYNWDITTITDKDGEKIQKNLDSLSHLMQKSWFESQ